MGPRTIELSTVLATVLGHRSSRALPTRGGGPLGIRDRGGLASTAKLPRPSLAISGRRGQLI
eukprot:3898833-Pyramimonas_sp.AAC.1